MHDNADILVTMLIFLAAAVVLVPLFKWLKASTVLGYLAAGLLIGPEVLGLVRDTTNISTLAHLGVVFLLFTLGLELSFERLRSIRSYVFGLGSLQVGLTGAVFGFMAWYGGMSVNASIIVGGALAFSSTAFVMQLLQERGELGTKPGRISFSVLLLQDIAVVFFLALLPPFPAWERRPWARSTGWRTISRTWSRTCTRRPAPSPCCRPSLRV